MNRYKLHSSGCQNVSYHISEACICHPFSIQFLEKLPGTGYVNDKIYPGIRSEPLNREEYWI